MLRDLGSFGLTIPERYGGLGLSTLAHPVREEWGRAHAAFNMLISADNGIGVMGLIIAGSKAPRQRWLPRRASDEWSAAFALTEPNAGSDAQAIETRASRDGDRCILNGTKHYSSRGDIPQLVTVFAVTDATRRRRGGITVSMVEKDTPGFRVARRLSLGARCLGTMEELLALSRAHARNPVQFGAAAHASRHGDGYCDASPGLVRRGPPSRWEGKR
jgi:alkylation response protein AidB-like acyl-CoA dehydrogenase